MIELQYNRAGIFKIAFMGIACGVGLITFAFWALNHNFMHEHSYGRGALITSLGSKGCFALFGFLGALFLFGASRWVRLGCGELVALKADHEGLVIKNIDGEPTKVFWRDMAALKMRTVKYQTAKSKNTKVTVFLTVPPLSPPPSPSFWSKMWFRTDGNLFNMPIKVLDLPEEQIANLARQANALRCNSLGIGPSSDDVYAPLETLQVSI